MAWAPDEETQQLIWHLALQNAFEYEGKGAVGSVIGRIMSTRADLRQYGGQISPLVAKMVQTANTLAQEQGLGHIESILSSEAAHLLEGRKKQESVKVCLNSKFQMERSRCFDSHQTQTVRFLLVMQEALSSTEHMQHNTMGHSFFDSTIPTQPSSLHHYLHTS